MARKTAADSPALSRIVYERLRADILSGELEPDLPLRLEFLRERYGLSFSPLREALNQLQVERLVSSTLNRGFRVAAVSLEEMWDAINARILVESEALRKSIESGDDMWEGRVLSSFHGLDRCRQRLARESDPPTPEELVMLEERHRAFHATLLEGCRSEVLQQIALTLYAQTERYRRPLLSIIRPQTVNIGGPDDEHRAMMMAALSRDSAQAVELLEQHLRATGRFIEQSHHLLAPERTPRAA